MKIIYLFQYQFKQEKCGLLNYKTFIIVNDEWLDKSEDIKNKAIHKFKENFPHVDFNTVEVSEFRGDMIDSCEPV